MCTHCDYWHVRSKKSDVHYRLCKCRGQKGQLKRAYLSLSDAERTRDKVDEMRSITLKVYECPRGSGWHLTSIE